MPEVSGVRIGIEEYDTHENRKLSRHAGAEVTLESVEIFSPLPLSTVIFDRILLLVARGVSRSSYTSGRASSLGQRKDFDD